MIFFTDQHQNYYGIDLHARPMYLCVQNSEGEIVLHRNMEARPEPFLKAIDPIEKISSSVLNASSPGIGWPISVLNEIYPSSLNMYYT
jgi:hypothetical protein